MEEKRNKSIGVIGTVFFHGVLIALLFFFGFPYVEQQDEEGILVMVGDMNMADNAGQSAKSEPLPVMPEPVPETSSAQASAPDLKEEVITQDQEESLALADADKKAKEDKERIRREAEKKRKAEAERKRQEEEKKKKEAAIKNRVANVFQNASQKASQGTGSNEGSSKGNPFGNSDTGATSGSPGYGNYDLGGRGIRGGLPRPSFSVNESGKVVVGITVNEEGKVINAIIGQGTTTTSPQLRNSALTAARKALFEVKSGVITQNGSITYYFDSDN